jgi:hypothetical protein
VVAVELLELGDLPVVAVTIPRQIGEPQLQVSSYATPVLVP